MPRPGPRLSIHSLFIPQLSEVVAPYISYGQAKKEELCVQIFRSRTQQNWCLNQASKSPSIRLYSAIDYCFQTSIKIEAPQFYNIFVCKLSHSFIDSFIKLILNSSSAQSIIMVDARWVLGAGCMETNKALSSRSAKAEVSKPQLGAQSHPLPVCVNKALLGHSHTCLCTCCLWLIVHCNSKVEQSQKRTNGPQSLNVHYLALYRESG